MNTGARLFSTPDDARSAASARVSAAGGSVADHLASGFRGWTFKAKRIGARTDGFVRARPWRAAGAVALAGLAAGVLLSRATERARARNDHSIPPSEVLGG